MEKKDKARRQLKAAAVKQTVIKTAQQGNAARQDLTVEPQESEQDYAGDKVQTFAENRAADAIEVVSDAARLAAVKRKATNERLAKAQKAASGSPEPTPESLPQAEKRRQTFQQGRYRKRAAGQVSTEKGARTVSSSPRPRPQELRKQAIKEKAVRQYLQKRTEKLAAQRAAGTSVPPQPIPRSGAAKFRERLANTLKQALQKLGAALAHVVRAAVQSLLGLLMAGGVVLLLALVIGAAAAIIGSPMGILFADESGDPNAIPIAAIVQETNAEFARAIDTLVAAHPECGEVDLQYEYEAGRTWASYWPEVLAVFAVNTNLNADSDVVVIDAEKAQQIKSIFWEMHEITSEVETVEVEPEPVPEEKPDDEAPDDDTEGDMDEEENGEDKEEAGPQYQYILHITARGKTVEQMAEQYQFTADQREILAQLLSDEMRPALLALCGGAIGSGTAEELLWPLPGHTNITTYFGESDAFGRLGHRGIDIAAPEGTPILAAHSGTVLVSGWNDSYGNQVLLDNGAGLSTRYAHMTVQAVAAGETVEAGQVIGYVGSTGDSTGFHLHFEVQRLGMLTDPLLVIG